MAELQDTEKESGEEKDPEYSEILQIQHTTSLFDQITCITKDTGQRRLLETRHLICIITADIFSEKATQEGEPPETK